MKIDVYRNLHKNCMSVRSREKDDYGKIIEHTNNLEMLSCHFIVRRKGKLRVRAEQRKNVHAFVRGELFSWDYTQTFDLDDFTEVTYNPYYNDTFVRKDNGAEVFSSQVVVIKNGKVFASLD